MNFFGKKGGFFGGDVVHSVLDAKWFRQSPSLFGQHILYPDANGQGYKLEEVCVPKPLQRQYIRRRRVDNLYPVWRLNTSFAFLNRGIGLR